MATPAANESLGSRSTENQIGTSRFRIPGERFFFLALELFLGVSVVWAWVITRVTWPGFEYAPESARWGLAALALGLVGLVLAAVGTHRWLGGRRVMGLQWIACSIYAGLAAVGLMVVFAVSTVDVRPVEIRLPKRAAPKAVGAASAATLPTGDAEQGHTIFVQTCATCHGVDAQGVANNAPSLRESEFIKTADPAAIASVIRNGRALNDPANKSGKVMPARGGNPFLDDAKIAHLVAFLKNLDSIPASSSGASKPSLSVEEMAANFQPAETVIKKWTAEDFQPLEIPTGEDAFRDGMMAFLRAGCHKCHMGSVGTKPLGPTIQQIGEKRYSDMELLTHILKPSEQIDESFQQSLFLTIDGKSITGTVIEETDTEIRLIPDLQKPDEVVTLLVDDIEDSRPATISPMPEGVADVLTKEEIVNLLSYLKQAGAPPPPTLNRWVLSAPSIPEKTRSDLPRTRFLGRSWDQDVNRSRFETAMNWQSAIAAMILAFHWVGAMILGTALIFSWAIDLSPDASKRLAREFRWYWIAGVIASLIWLALFLFPGLSTGF